jgi:hypothetical protein
MKMGLGRTRHEGYIYQKMQNNVPHITRGSFPFKWNFYFCWQTASLWARASSFMRFKNHTQRRTTVVRTPLDEWSARRRDLYLTTHNRKTSIPPVGGMDGTHDLSQQAAADPHLRQRGHWDRLGMVYSASPKLLHLADFSCNILLSLSRTKIFVFLKGTQYFVTVFRQYPPLNPILGES